jgi:hypothetical protein
MPTMPKNALAAICGWLILYLHENMALPTWFTEALAAESAQFKIIANELASEKELRAADQAIIAQRDIKVAELEALVATMPELQTKVDELKALNAELEANAINRDEALAAIADVNMSPVGSAAVEAVIAEVTVPTPEIVEASPEIAPEVIPEAEVAIAAADAVLGLE